MSKCWSVASAMGLHIFEWEDVLKLLHGTWGGKRICWLNNMVGFLNLSPILFHCPPSVAQGNFFFHCSTNGRAAAQTACCSAATPAVPSATSSVSTTTSYSGPSGNEPVCNICRTTEYPGLPSAMMIVRYVGGYTCDEFYHRGRNGMIPDYMCGPTQDFAQVVCGCGVYNPACRANPSACFGATQTSGSTTTYSLTARTSLTAAPRSSPRASTYSSTPGVRNLRGSDADEVEQEQPPQPEAVEIDPSDAAADVSSEMESQA